MNETESECMATLSNSIAEKINAGGPINKASIADIVWALSSGPKTIAVLQGWIDELESEFEAP